MKKTFEIEKNIPLPEIGSKYPYKTMEVGDSFLITNPSINNRGYPISYLPRKNSGITGKFAQRTTPEGIRVWRIE